jgi:drug/metabolite transporter (DMT)-like permease
MKKAYIYIALATLIISTMEISGRVLSQTLNPTQINFWRFLIGSVILMPMTFVDLRKRGVRLGRSDILFLIATGFVGMAVSMELFQMALATAKASVVAVIASCVPICVIPFARVFLKEKLTVRTALAMALSTLGVLSILNPFDLDPETTGITLAIGEVVTFALYNVMGKRQADRCGGLAVSCLSMFSGAAILGVMILLSYVVPAPAAGGLFSQFYRIPLFEGVDSGNILNLLYFSVVGTGLLYALLFLAMEATTATIGSVVFFFKPALAPIFAWMMLGESISGRVLAGIALIVCGASFVLNPTRAPAAANAGRDVALAPIGRGWAETPAE